MNAEISKKEEKMNKEDEYLGTDDISTPELAYAAGSRYFRRENELQKIKKERMAKHRHGLWASRDDLMADDRIYAATCVELDKVCARHDLLRARQAPVAPPCWPPSEESPKK